MNKLAQVDVISKLKKILQVLVFFLLKLNYMQLSFLPKYISFSRPFSKTFKFQTFGLMAYNEN